AVGIALAVGVATAVAAATFAPCFHTSFPLEETTVYTYPRHTIFWPTLVAFNEGPAACATNGNRRVAKESKAPFTTVRRLVPDFELM
ncbi:MAG: hypothetical protein EBW39_09615, partial [Betaproteobacteria bacterium]|nr:hypothetical protein [Betaproteobacteria bacterium]